MKKVDDKFLEYIENLEVDEVELSQEEIERIHKMELDKTRFVKPVKSKIKWWQTAGIAAVAILIISITLITQNSNQTDPLLLNPIVEYEDINSAEKAIGYDFSLPEYLPEGFSQQEIFIIDNEIVSIDYVSDTTNINYRTSQGSKDNSGDFTIYNNEKIIDIKGLNITIRGNDEKINLAIWQDNSQSFSISTKDGLLESEIIKIIESIKK